MNEVWQTLLGAAAGAAGAVATIFLLLRRLAERWIDQRFSRLEGLASQRLALQADLARQFTEAQVGVYPALGELVYRAKAGADRARRAATNAELLNEELILACRELTDQLYRVRIYLPGDLFEALHAYKHDLQDLLVIGDILTRPEPGRGVEPLSPEQRERVEALYESIARRCDEILPRLHERMRSMQGPLAAGE